MDNFRLKSKFAKIEKFFVQENITDFKGWTKWLILKFAVTVYDPHGLISPFTVRSRKILQKLWQEKLIWTDIIPTGFSTQRCIWLDELINAHRRLKFPDLFTLRKAKVTPCMFLSMLAQKLTQQLSTYELKTQGGKGI